MSFSPMTYGDISPRVGLYAVANFLAHAEPVLVLERFAKVEQLPKNKGQIVKWRRFVPFAINTTALVEGVTPAPNQLQYEDVTTMVNQYGGWVSFSDVIVDTHEDPNLQKISMGLGEQAASTKEALIWEELVGGTAVLYSGAATSRATVTDVVQAADLVAAQRFLKANRAKHLTRVLKASQLIATEPVAPAFVAFGHSNLEPDLRDLPEFVVREKYSNMQLLSEYEIGKFQDIRFILSPQLTPFWGAGGSPTGVLSRDGVAADVYPIVIVGQDI